MTETAVECTSQDEPGGAALCAATDKQLIAILTDLACTDGQQLTGEARLPSYQAGCRR